MYKEILVIFLIVLACSCWLTDSGASPSPIPVGVKGTAPIDFGMTRAENQMIQNFGYTSDSRAIGLMTRINSTGTQEGADLPFDAAW